MKSLLSLTLFCLSQFRIEKQSILVELEQEQKYKEIHPRPKRGFHAEERSIQNKKTARS